MTEEIIVDGVNVAGCEFYFEDNGVIAPDGTPERENLCTSPEKSCENSDSCYCNKDCRYKQLKRLEQERDELKKQNAILLGQLVINDGEDVTVQISQSQFDEYNELKQENKELKELNKKICEDWEKEIKVYWNALEEIRELTFIGVNTSQCNCGLRALADDILNKIDEVLK